jgi:hypothetical protein
MRWIRLSELLITGIVLSALGWLCSLTLILLIHYAAN